jgi:serine/threonine-protein kinase
MHRNATPEPIGPRRPDAPAHLLAIVMKCLEKKPGDRPRSGDEIADALDPEARARHSGGLAKLVARAPAWLPWAVAGASTIAAIALALLLLLRDR